MKDLISFSFTTLLFFITPVLFAQNALHFSRTGDYVQTSYPGVQGSNDRTFEAWIYVEPGAPAANLCILDYGDNVAGSRNTFAVSGTRKLSFTSGGTNANISSTATGVVPEGVWTQVAFVLDNGTGYLYVDGVQVGSGSLTSVNTPSGGTDLRIGERVPGGSIAFQGMIDDVRIWSVARTAQEIQADTNREFCSIPPGLAAYYSFDQGIAGGNNTGLDSLVERVGGNHGNLTGFALMGNTSNWVGGKSLVSAVVAKDTAVACDSFVSPSGNHTWTTSGTHYDTLTTSYGCDSVMEVALTINFVSPSVNLNGNTIYAGQSGANYLWLDCDNNYQAIPGETNQTFTPTANGNYAVHVEQAGCADTSVCVAIGWVGINDLAPTALAVYPNPSNGEIRLDGLAPGELSIVDAKGTVVYKTTISHNVTTQTISLPPAIEDGMYLVYLQNSQNFIMRKLLIMRE